MEEVILVNDLDEQIGLMEKLEAHEKGLKHRAFSVFVFNSKGEMLIQRRAIHKYHSGGLWSNACCSHPRNEEDTINAANRRLFEEMGMKSFLDFSFKFSYEAVFSNGLIEHELDHVFIGYSDEAPLINTEEVCDWKYISKQALLEDMEKHPYNYTEWFKICLVELYNRIDFSAEKNVKYA